MGFPYAEATWDVVDGAMFMGWGGSMPGLYTLIAMGICVAVLVVGQRSERAKYDKQDK